MPLKKRFQSYDENLEPRPETEYCLKCAVCGLVCVVNFAEIYEPRRTFVYDLYSGDIQQKQTLWGCPSCHKCEERCPYEFSPLTLVKAHKEAAFKAGEAPKEVYAVVESILATGSAFPVSSATHRQREKLELPAMPEKPAGELAIIAEQTGLNRHLVDVHKQENG
jgi:heterodisulfide reductase subunit C